MRLAVLFSGGKDSTYAAFVMSQMGHQISALVSIHPSDPHSWIFHTPNLKFVPKMAEVMGLPLVMRESTGEEGSDLEALKEALSAVDVDGVVTGAIASDYQWDRINGVCQELDLKVFSPLWRKDQQLLLEDMVSSGLRAVLVSISAEGLGPEWLGRELDGGALADLKRVAERTGMNLAGEGGEYETLVLDSPLHRAPLRMVDAAMQLTRDGGTLVIRGLEVC